MGGRVPGSLLPRRKAWTPGDKPGKKHQAGNPRVRPSPAIPFPWDAGEFISSLWPQLSLLKKQGCVDVLERASHDQNKRG